jgi:hypothetical protein
MATRTLSWISCQSPAGSASCTSFSFLLPTIDLGRRPGFEGLQAKVTLDFGCGWSDFRGAAKNVGA